MLAALAAVSLSACSEDGYEGCKAAATDDWEDRAQSAVRNGSGNSVGGYMQSLSDAIYQSCGVPSDPRWQTKE